jgi:hypothetical protein
MIFEVSGAMLKPIGAQGRDLGGNGFRRLTIVDAHRPHLSFVAI